MLAFFRITTFSFQYMAFSVPCPKGRLGPVELSLEQLLGPHSEPRLLIPRSMIGCRTHTLFARVLSIRPGLFVRQVGAVGADSFSE